MVNGIIKRSGIPNQKCETHLRYRDFFFEQLCATAVASVRDWFISALDRNRNRRRAQTILIL